MSIYARGPKPRTFDLEMEILASIPLRFKIKLRVLASDFEISRAECRGILMNLSDRGVRFAMGEEWEMVWIEPECRAEVLRVTSAYWRNTWDERR